MFHTGPKELAWHDLPESSECCSFLQGPTHFPPIAKPSNLKPSSGDSACSSCWAFSSCVPALARNSSRSSATAPTNCSAFLMPAPNSSLVILVFPRNSRAWDFLLLFRFCLQLSSSPPFLRCFITSV